MDDLKDKGTSIFICMYGSMGYTWVRGLILGVGVNIFLN